MLTTTEKQQLQRAQGWSAERTDIIRGMEEGRLTVSDGSGFTFRAVCDLSQRQRGILLAGGLLNYTREGGL